jgi:hypothetical protein
MTTCPRCGEAPLVCDGCKKEIHPKDSEFLEAIAEALDAQTWTPATLDRIADIVRASGREIRDVDQNDADNPEPPDLNDRAAQQRRQRMIRHAQKTGKIHARCNRCDRTSWIFPNEIGATHLPCYEGKTDTGRFFPTHEDRA